MSLNRSNARRGRAPVLDIARLIARVAAGAGLATLASGSIAAALPPLGLCPPELTRLDGFMRTVCDGETLLRAGRHAEAVERFRQAAELQRLQATNEIAWAGLAAAYCEAQDRRRGQEWAARFDEARRLWLGEWDCDADAPMSAPHRSFVRKQMCSDSLAADYKFVRDHPQAAASVEIAARLAAVSKSVAQYCAVVPVKSAAHPPAAEAAHGKQGAKKKPRRKLSGKRGSPTPER